MNGQIPAPTQTFPVSDAVMRHVLQRSGVDPDALIPSAPEPAKRPRPLVKRCPRCKTRPISKNKPLCLACKTIVIEQIENQEAELARAAASSPTAEA